MEENRGERQGKRKEGRRDGDRKKGEGFRRRMELEEKKGRTSL